MFANAFSTNAQIRDKFLEKKPNLEQKHDSKLTLKLPKIYKSQKHNVFTVERNKIALNANDDNRVESIDSVETFEYEQAKTYYGRQKKGNVII